MATRPGRAEPLQPAAMHSATGKTTGGLPLSYNRAPREELKPWIARIGVTSVTMPEGQQIECGVFSEHPIQRINYGCHWAATTERAPA